MLVRMHYEITFDNRNQYGLDCGDAAGGDRGQGGAGEAAAGGGAGQDRSQGNVWLQGQSAVKFLLS